jgi:tetratricopeptide (TPR) repeat protein
MGWGSYYLFWFAAPVILSLVTAHPAIIVVALIAFVARRWLPDPFLFFKYGGRISRLRHEIAANPHNAAAQRELALIYIDKRRPAKAVPLLEAALRREPESADLLYHHGLALLGAKQWQNAADQFVAAVARDPRIAYGESYLRAGQALVHLGRLEDAEQGFEHAAAVNGSNVEARYRLGAVRAARGDSENAKTAFADARNTYHQLPAFQKRKTWWWAFRAWQSS